MNWATVSASVIVTMAWEADIMRAAVEERSEKEETSGGLSEVIKSHLQHICGVATDYEVPDIWAEVVRARTVATKMALLTQFLQTDLSECRNRFFGHVEDMLHAPLPLLNFVMKRQFSNIGPYPACPAGGFSGWTSPQGLASDRGAAMDSMEADTFARDLRMATDNQISRSSKLILDVVVDGCRARLETGTVAYFLWRLFGAQCPFVMELTGLLTWSETNQVTFDGRVKNLHDATAFVADVSRVLGQYLNSCVVASTTAGLYDPGSCTPVSLDLIL